MSAVTCHCGREADPVYEEVDIGVGVQEFLVAWECPEHGGVCGVCFGCGIPDRVGQTHESWCGQHPSVTITAESFEAETDKIRDGVLARFQVGEERRLQLNPPMRELEAIAPERTPRASGELEEEAMKIKNDDSARVSAGIVVERVEMVVDGGRVVGVWGVPEINLAWPPGTPMSDRGDHRFRAKVSVPRSVISKLPIGARVVLQLEVLPGAPKAVSKKGSKKRSKLQVEIR